MSPFVFGVAGWSKVGKTTLVERLTSELVARGYRVATLKHDVHGFDMDHPGKDTWRHRQAGAEATLLVGPGQIALIRSGDSLSTSMMIKMLGDVDIVLAEGFKGAVWFKLEVHQGEGPLACLHDQWLLALAGPKRPEACPVPWWHWDDIGSIADLVEHTRTATLAGR